MKKSFFPIVVLNQFKENPSLSSVPHQSKEVIHDLETNASVHLTIQKTTISINFDGKAVAFIVNAFKHAYGWLITGDFFKDDFHHGICVCHVRIFIFLFLLDA